MFVRCTGDMTNMVFVIWTISTKNGLDLVCKISNKTVKWITVVEKPEDQHVESIDVD